MKKLFYGLGAIAAVATPVVAVVSCGSKAKASVEGDFTALKALADKVNGHVNPDLIIQGGSATDATSKPVTQLVVGLTHEQTVAFFKGIGLLKDGDNTDAAEFRFENGKYYSDNNTEVTPTADQLKAFNENKFQKAVEAFIQSGAIDKFNSFVKAEYEKFDKENANKQAGQNLVVADDLVSAQFHSEGYKFGTADSALGYVTTEARNQGAKGYSYLAFKLKLEDTALEGGFSGKTIADATEQAKFTDAKDALVHAFTELSQLKSL